MKKLFRHLYILSAGILLGSLPMFGQSAGFSNINTDLRTFSMGLQYQDIAAIPLSPQKFNIDAGYMLWQPEVMNNDLISLRGWGKIADKFGVYAQGRYFNYDPQTLFDKNGNPGEVYTPGELAVDLGFSFKIISCLSMGVTARFINSNLNPKFGANTFSADISLMYRIKGLSLSLAATNLGGKLQYSEVSYRLPAMGRLAAAYHFDLAEKHKLDISAEGGCLLYQDAFEVGGGLEYVFNDLLFVRGGYHYGHSTASIPAYGSVGLGLKLKGIKLNAAYLISPDSNLRNTFALSLGYQF